MEKKEMIVETKKQQDEIDKRMKIKPEEQGEKTMELTENEKMFLKKQEDDEKAAEKSEKTESEEEKKQAESQAQEKK